VLEIGFGMGEATAQMAADDPTTGILAVDVHTPGQGNLLRLADRNGLSNIRVGNGDAIILLREMLKPDALDGLRVYFPDPWPKARHHKRRLVSAATVSELARIMPAGAELRIATDDGDYARWILLAVLGHRDFSWMAAGAVDWRQRPPDWPPTRYEQKAHDAGRRCYYFRFRRG